MKVLTLKITAVFLNSYRWTQPVLGDQVMAIKRYLRISGNSDKIAAENFYQMKEKLFKKT